MAVPFLTGIDLRKNELLNARVQNLTNAPASPVTGQLYYDTDDNTLYVWDGTSWYSTRGGAPSGAAGGDLTGTYPNPTVDVNKITFAKMQDIATDRLIGRDTAASGDPEEIAVGGGVEFSGAGGIQRSALTGDVTAAAGSNATTIANDAVTNAKAANMVQATIKGRQAGGGTGDPEDLTPAQAKTILAIVPGDVTGFDTQVRTSRLDQMAAPTAAVPFNGQRITGVADPAADQDAATKAYVDAAAAGIDWKASVRAATTGNIANLAGGAPDTVDGVALAANDRVLVKDQGTGSQNGIYRVQTLGTGANGTWVRAADADADAELTSGAGAFVEEGTVNADTGWTLTTNGAIVVGTTALTFTQFTSLGQVTAGAGLTKTGSTIDVNVGAGLEVSGDAVRIAAAAAGAGLTGGAGSALDVNAGAGLEISGDAVRIAAAAAGNGLTGGAGAALAVGAGTGLVANADDVAVNRTGTNGAHVPLLHAATIGDNAATSIAITHNLGTRDVIVQVYDAATYETVYCDVVRTSTTVVTLTFATAPANNSLRAVIHG